MNIYFIGVGGAHRLIQFKEEQERTYPTSRNGGGSMFTRTASVNFRPPLGSARSIHQGEKKDRLPMAAVKEVKLKAVEATPETFKEFGQVVGPSPDGEEFGPQDAQLDLSRGIPRFCPPILLFVSYVLRKFSIIHC